VAGYFHDRVCSNRGFRRRVTACLAALFVYFSISGAVAWRTGLFAFQRQLYDSALWLESRTAKDARIGAISAGIYGYMTQRTVDLAGVVNEEAYRAMRDKRFFSYLLEKRIDYLVDREDMVRFYSRQFDRDGFMGHLEPVKRFGENASDIVVYRIRRGSERL